MQFLVVVAKFLLLINKVHSKFFVMFCKLCALEMCILVENSLCLQCLTVELDRCIGIVHISRPIW